MCTMYKGQIKRPSYFLTRNALLRFFSKSPRGEVAAFHPVYSVSQDVLKSRFICL